MSRKVISLIGIIIIVLLGVYWMGHEIGYTNTARVLAGLGLLVFWTLGRHIHRYDERRLVARVGSRRARRYKYFVRSVYVLLLVSILVLIYLNNSWD